MGGTLSFKIEDVKKVIEASVNSLVLVGDHGVYLCSDVKPDGAEKCVVAYAKGINPEVDDFESWWEKKGRIFGGDDGVETLNLEEFKNMMKFADENKVKTLKIKLTARSMSISMVPGK